MVVSGTTLVVFGCWTQLIELIARYPVLSILASGVISVGIYRLIATIFLWLFRKSSYIKKRILGPYYMEGTWVGFFIGHQEKVRFFVEFFEQDLNDLVIRGKAFREEDGKYHGSWVSDNVNINTKLGKISYTYETDAIGNTFVNPGIAQFNIERTSKDQPPCRLIGFTSDLFNPQKLKSFEQKISEKTEIDSKEAFNRAKEIFELNKDHI